MSERPGRMPKFGDWPAAITIQADDIDLMALNENSRPESPTVTTPVFESRKHSPSGIADDCSSLKTSSSVFTQISAQVPAQLPAQFPDQVSPLLSHPSPPSTPSSSHYRSSSSSSTIRPPSNRPLEFEPEFHPRPFEFIPQVYSPLGLQSQSRRYPFETVPQLYHNPVDISGQFQPSKYLSASFVVISQPAIPPPVKLFEPH